MKTKCTECDGAISVPVDVVKGEVLTCPDCGMDFEVVEVNTTNVMLSAAETVGEDWGE